MELIGGLIGAGLAAVAPMVPGLRPVAKAVIKTGMAMAEVTVAVAATISEQVTDLFAHAHKAPEGETIVEGASTPATEAAPPVAETPEKMGDAAAAVAAAAATDAAGGADVTAAEASAAVGQAAEAAASLSAHAEDHAGPVSADDLVRIRGIGPKTVSLLHAAGITTFAQLASTSVDQLRAILQQAGGRYRIIDPTSWPAQAQEILATPAQD